MPNESHARRRIIVDGSNIATEGRTLPSLDQLDEAIRAFLDEYPGFTTADVTVVVDASFSHRIDPSEVPAFEEAILHGEMVTPPAGAIGRGDGFILRIAEKSGALVLSNDSFQEFHAERPWLFDEGRLIGGKPVPGIGWVFTPRTPVRGPKSRAVTSRSRRDARSGQAESEAVDGTVDAEVTDGPDGAESSRSTKTSKSAKADKSKKAAKAEKAEKSGKATKAKKVDKAEKAPKTGKAAKSDKAAKEAKPAKAAKSTKAAKVAKPTKEAAPVKAAGSRPAKATARTTKASTFDEDAAPSSRGRGRGGRPEAAATSGGDASGGSATRGSGPGGSGREAPALNEPLAFLTFVAEHPVGSTFEGTVVSFTSHGAHVDVGSMRCHVPLRGLADPPAVKARDVLTKGETREFVLVSLDAGHRRAELALPGIHH